MKFCRIVKIFSLFFFSLLVTNSLTVEAYAIDYKKDVKINFVKSEIDSIPLDFAGIKPRGINNNNFWASSSTHDIANLIVSTDVTKIPKIFVNNFYEVISTGGSIEDYSLDGKLIEIKLSKLILGNKFLLAKKIIVGLPYEYQEDYIFTSKKIEMNILQYSFEQNCLIANNKLSKEKSHYIYWFISAVCEIKNNRKQALENLNYYVDNSVRALTAQHLTLISYLVDNKKIKLKNFLPELFQDKVSSLDIFLMYRVAEDFDVLFDFYPAALYFYTKNSKKLNRNIILRLLEYDMIDFSKFQRIVMSSKSQQIGQLRGIFKPSSNSKIKNVSSYVGKRNDSYLPLLKELYLNKIPMARQEELIAGLLIYLEQPTSLSKIKIVKSSKVYSSLKLFEDLHQKQTNQIHSSKDVQINTFQLYKAYSLAEASSGQDFMMNIDKKIINIVKSEKNYINGYRYRELIRLRDQQNTGEIFLKIYRIISNPKIQLSLYDMSLIIETLNVFDTKSASQLARYFIVKENIT